MEGGDQNQGKVECGLKGNAVTGEGEESSPSPRILDLKTHSDIKETVREGSVIRF